MTIMRGEIDGHYVAAQIRLVRQIHKGSILILEGETDAKALEQFVDSAACDIEIAFGKDNALQALDLLEDEAFAGVVAVVDADFDRLTGITYRVENLCVTDHHDLDLTIFASLALDRYVAQHADKDRFKAEFQSDISLVRKKIIDACLPLACLRLTSERRSLRLYFKEMKLDQYVERSSLKLDCDKLISDILSRSSTNCTEAHLRDYMESECACAHDAYQLVQGHDAAGMLGIALRQLLATRRDVHTWASEIEAGLRLAFDWEAAAGTKVYGCLRAWEKNNAPFRIFRQLPAQHGTA